MVWNHNLTGKLSLVGNGVSDRILTSIKQNQHCQFNCHDDIPHCVVARCIHRILQHFRDA